ncbi:hypothetical protein [Ochrobactrum sp. MC-1LL]|uniref:hypothetical protein n=1 Tax=Ochrobactrum sp. MC-1LL TaxID=2735351 RepID=UPI0014385370|nr:hypothetical protein [Ochrobactrum sp. MC-1LL]NKE75363.1 hypothetical protein [Ochrobactrum sp. MC-1LL]NKE77847.1 hypothetical protein [Ochrobactrum sp. MC-1LL]
MTTLPEEAVKAAIATYMTFGIDDEMMREALTAALPFLPVQVAVKKLEWGELRYTEDYSFAQDAETSIGRYIATDNGWFLQGQSGWKSEDDIEAAKAAAQADYERRILSAIEAAPPLSKLKAENARLKAQLAEALKALGIMLREHDILSGNFGDVMDPKHRRPDRWPTAAEAARRVLEGGETNG